MSRVESALLSASDHEAGLGLSGLVFSGMARGAWGPDGRFSGYASVSDAVVVSGRELAGLGVRAVVRAFMRSRRDRFDGWVDAMPAFEWVGDDLVLLVARPLDVVRGRRYAGTVGVREF